MIYPNEYCNEYRLPLRLWLCKRLKIFEVRIENPREESEGLHILHIGESEGLQILAASRYRRRADAVGDSADRTRGGVRRRIHNEEAVRQNTGDAKPEQAR